MMWKRFDAVCVVENRLHLPYDRIDLFLAVVFWGYDL